MIMVGLSNFETEFFPVLHPTFHIGRIFAHATYIVNAHFKIYNYKKNRHKNILGYSRLIAPRWIRENLIINPRNIVK